MPNPKSKQYGKVIHKLSVGRARRSASHGLHRRSRDISGPAGSTTSKIYVFDVGTNPAKPTLVRTIADLPKQTGFAGPHTFYALPGRMLVQALSNTKDHGGVTGMVVYNNKRPVRRKYAMPAGEIGGGQRRWIWLRPRHQSSQERPAHVELLRLEQLHERSRRARQRRGGDEAFRQHDGSVGLEGDEAAEDVRGPRRSARDPLVAEARRQLGDRRDRAHLQALADQAGAGGNGRRKRSARSPTRRRSRCRWTSASPPTARAYGSTRSWTERRVTSTSPTPKRRRRPTRR